MASRRGQGEGSVYQETRTYQTKAGPVTSTSWVATVEDDRDPATGRRRQVKLRAKTKAAAKRPDDAGVTGGGRSIRLLSGGR